MGQQSTLFGTAAGAADGPAVPGLEGSPGKLRVGTSGYQYPDWVGGWYPAGLAGARMLDHYCRHFDTVELNSSYYGIPRLSTTRKLAEQTPPGFVTVVKAYKGMTHEFEGWEVYDRFREALEPLVSVGKLGGILFQFPPWFENDERRRRYLRKLPDLYPAVPLIVEFRSRDWICDPTFDLLEEVGLSFSCVDEPDLPQLVPRLARVTTRLGYLRFHSRDRAKWYRGGAARYDYEYTDAELEEWIAKILPLLDRVDRFIVYFNNCKRSQAAYNAERFKALLAAPR